MSDDENKIINNESIITEPVNKTKINGSEKIFDPVNQKLVQIKYEHEQTIKDLIAKNKRLLAIIAHDLKTPLSAIVGFLSLTKDRIYNMDNDKIEKNIDIALHSAKKSFDLLENLLEWAFSENTIRNFRQEYIRLNELLDVAIQSVHLFASQKQIKINILNINKEKVYVDKNMIQSVVRNLLNNAIKYSHKMGEITMSSVRNNKYVHISIKDNGVGIKQEVLDNIFSSNHFLSALGTNNESGTGFGLLLCKEFIDLHGGDIKVISEPGVGSEFILTLPI